MRKKKSFEREKRERKKREKKEKAQGRNVPAPRFPENDAEKKRSGRRICLHDWIHAIAVTAFPSRHSSHGIPVTACRRR